MKNTIALFFLQFSIMYSSFESIKTFFDKFNQFNYNRKFFFVNQFSPDTLKTITPTIKSSECVVNNNTYTIDISENIFSDQKVKNARDCWFNFDCKLRKKFYFDHYSFDYAYYNDIKIEFKNNNNKIIANCYSIINKVDNSAYGYSLFIHQDYRNQGIATHIIHTLKNQLIEKNVYTIYLYDDARDKDNNKIKNFYERFGCEKTGEFVMNLKNNTQVFQYRCMINKNNI
jgi:ribosomal protein S18 acetylase RimI-like enzyme